MEVIVVAIIALAAGAAVVYPLLRPRPAFPGGGAQAPGTRAADASRDDDALEREVGRYREALRAGTLCRRCPWPNPPGSRFCAECGRALG